MATRASFITPERLKCKISVMNTVVSHQFVVLRNLSDLALKLETTRENDHPSFVYTKRAWLRLGAVDATEVTYFMVGHAYTQPI